MVPPEGFLPPLKQLLMARERTLDEVNGRTPLVWDPERQRIRSNEQLSTTRSNSAASQNGTRLSQSLTCPRLGGPEVTLFLKSYPPAARTKNMGLSLYAHLIFHSLIGLS